MKVKFVPQNLEFDIAPGQSVLNLAQEKDVFIKSVCNGLPSCAECRVRVVEGEENVLPPSAKELGLIGTGYFIDQRRLSCQLRCFGDVTIDLTEQVAKQTQGPRRPQGSKKAEVEVSHAVSGNLLEQEQDLMKQASTVVQEPRDRGPREQRNQGGGSRGGGRGRQDRKHGRRDRDPRRS
jgi:2Fe-2S ferredoxin